MRRVEALLVERVSCLVHHSEKAAREVLLLVAQGDPNIPWPNEGTEWVRSEVEASSLEIEANCWSKAFRKRALTVERKVSLQKGAARSGPPRASTENDLLFPDQKSEVNGSLVLPAQVVEQDRIGHGVAEARFPRQLERRSSHGANDGKSCDRVLRPRDTTAQMLAHLLDRLRGSFVSRS